MSKRTLLLADDSVTIQKVVNLTFADEGIDVITVGDGDSAMQKISEVSPDVVLADVHMPGLSGYQICEIVRGNPGTRDLPVVLLVGSFEPFDEGEAARVGANAYLTKPFQSIRQLVTQVTDLMQSAPPELPQAPESAQPPTEVIEQPPPPGGMPDTTDIESLYHQSFGGPAAQIQEPAPPAQFGEETHNAFGDQTYEDSQTDAAAGTSPFVDAGMDDEMIDTNHVGAADESHQATGYDQPQTGYEDQAYSPTPESEYAPEPEYRAESEADQTVHENMHETGWAPAENHLANTGAFDSYAEAKSESSSSRESYDEPVVEFDEFSRTEQIPASVTASSFDLDDLELLDLPPLEGISSERSESQGGRKETVNLSPEQMDILVQRIVEKLSKDK